MPMVGRVPPAASCAASASWPCVGTVIVAGAFISLPLPIFDASVCPIRPGSKSGMSELEIERPAGWMDGVRPYFEKAPLAALALGISSGFPYAMIGATLTTRLAQDGIDKKTVTAFSLAFLVYNLKWI